LLRTTTSQLDRSDEGGGLLGTWSNSVLERSGVAGRDVGQQREEKPAYGGTNLSRDGSSGEPKREDLGKVLDAAKGSPDYSIRVVDLRFDHISKGVDIFLDVKHRQRHGTREPYRRLRKV